MSLDAAYKHFAEAQDSAQEWFTGEIAGLRTGRVKTNMVADLPVEHYGARTPLQGVANLALTDARTITISPWDPSAIPAIEKALIAAQVGAQPIVEGKIVRLSFPMLNEEMREKTIKTLHTKAEETRRRLRQSRDEALAILKADKQGSDITEDDFYEGKKKLDAMIDEANHAIEATLKKKEEEIRTI